LVHFRSGKQAERRLNNMPDEAIPLSEEQLLAILKSPKVADALRPSSPWMGPEETARYLGIALGTLRNWTSAHYIPFVKKGRIVRYHRLVIDRWLAKGACRGRATLADV
jgi:excisionase family DNA binding protein